MGCQQSKESVRPSQSITMERARLQYSSIDGIYWRSKDNLENLPPVFSLIKIKPVELSAVKITDFEDTKFPILSFKVNELVQFASQIIGANEHASQNFNQARLKRLITKFAENYNVVAYHNFSHAFSLMAMLNICFKRSEDLNDLYSPEEKFHILIAALAHDLNHNGTNSGYEVKLKSESAKIANNEGVLEKMHLRELWKITEGNRDLDFLQYSLESGKAKRLITRLIMSTDLAKHNKNLQDLAALQKNGTFNEGDDEHRALYMKNLFHGCDIGNSVLGFDNYLNWSCLLRYQFQDQTRLQEMNGLEVTQTMLHNDIEDLCKDQSTFVESMVLPLWKELSVKYTDLGKFAAKSAKNLTRIKLQLKATIDERKKAQKEGPKK